MLVSFKIQKFNPEVDAKPYYRDYEIELPERATVLESIIAIKEEIDGTLSFRCSCRSAICGSCAMRINRCAKLACKARVADEVNRHGSILIEPLQKLKVIKDLVVDMDPFWRMIEKVKPYLMPDPNEAAPERERLVDPSTTEDVIRNSLCILCACCHTDCNVAELEPGFVGPAALAKGQRYVADTRDGATDERLKSLSEPHGLWECARCFACTQVCPKGVDPRESIRRIGHLAYERGIRSDEGIKHAQAFLDSVKASGRLNEATLPLKTKGLGVVGMTPMALQMFLKGKVPFPIQRPVPDMEEIRKIFELTEKQR
ncbi:MAG: succinate dehydrogenase iron-sulfur subunit [Chloroflexi bacterium]|nr:succinate dehydrogenase iron-sulfur subunit [Chloroflexota bacterium]MDA8188362.1 succinate dehydrogenase iron-sulfur subunit [Dehalococcoidales bacterium]